MRKNKMLTPGKTYEDVYDAFKWQIPQNYNIGVDICDKWAHQRSRLALIYEEENGRVDRYTFRDLKNLSNKLANGLQASNIGIGDRLGILLPQCPETALSHIAAYKVGAVAIPLFTLFGTDALEYRLSNSEARAVVTDAANLPKIMEIRDNLPELKTILVTGGKKDEVVQGFWDLVEKGSSDFQPVNTRADDPALKLMRQVSDPKSRHNYRMRSIGSGGETLGEELLDWGRDVMGLTINEFYGQTECNLIEDCCADVMDIRPGSMGRAIPGHVVDVIDGNGQPVKAGIVGEIAVKRPDPVMFLEYWRNPDATRKKIVGDWLLTGDLAKKDADGYFWFNGRKDDVITSAGYRIGPAEIEDCLMKHPAVAMVAVVGSPDDLRTEIVKAFIVPKPEVSPGPDIEEDIKKFVKARLAAHEYPREIEFVNELPMTATGKIMRKELKKLELERKTKVL